MSKQDDKCSSCPECGMIKTVLELDDDLGNSSRICSGCGQEWWTNIKYDHHIDSTQSQGETP